MTADFSLDPLIERPHLPIGLQILATIGRACGLCNGPGGSCKARTNGTNRTGGATTCVSCPTLLVPAPHATFSAELPPTTGVANERKKEQTCAGGRRAERNRPSSPAEPPPYKSKTSGSPSWPPKCSSFAQDCCAEWTFTAMRPSRKAGKGGGSGSASSRGSDRREPRQTGVAASALSGLPHGSGVSYRFASQKRCPLTSHRGRRTPCRIGVHSRHPPLALVPPTSAATAAGVLRHPLATPEMLPRTNRLGLRLTCAGGGSAA